jgi:hypothetical protein
VRGAESPPHSWTTPGNTGHFERPPSFNRRPLSVHHCGGRWFESTAAVTGAERRVIPRDEARSASRVEVTAVSRIRGTQGIQEDTKGYGEVGG